LKLLCSVSGGGVASYIPGTEANRVSRAEHGQHPNYGTGNNQGYGRSNNTTTGNQGYGGSTGTGTGTGTGSGIASYIPGTEANRESRAAHGQDPNAYSSGNTGTGTGGGIASYIPGTEANRESRAAHGQDPNTYSSGNNNTGSNQGYGSGNTGGGVASYIPGTEANRESRAAHGQNPNTYSSGNTGSNTGTVAQTLYCCVHPGHAFGSTTLHLPCFIMSIEFQPIFLLQPLCVLQQLQLVGSTAASYIHQSARHCCFLIVLFRLTLLSNARLCT